MAERKFDYANVAEVYKEMTKINESIADTLSTIDQEYKNTVNVSEEAVYGDLGRQLLLDWENTSSNFPNFVNKFETWATLIAQTAGKYSDFERDVSTIKGTFPLGATSNAAKDAYVNTGVFSQYNKEGLDTLEKSVGMINPLTGETYLNTNQVDKEKSRKLWAGVNFALGAFSTVAGAYGAYSQFAASGAQVVKGAAISADGIVSAAAGSADDIASIAGSAAAGSADDIASAAASAAAGSADDAARSIAGAIGSTADDFVDDAASAAGKAAAGAADDFVDDAAKAAGNAASQAASGAGQKVTQEAAEEIAKKGLKGMTQADKSAFADFLGVSEEEIVNGVIKDKSVWRALVRKFHPDNGGSDAIMDILNELNPS